MLSDVVAILTLLAYVRPKLSSGSIKGLEIAISATACGDVHFPG